VLPGHQKTPATATLPRQNQTTASLIDDETPVIPDTSHTLLTPRVADAQHISATSIVNKSWLCEAFPLHSLDVGSLTHSGEVVPSMSVLLEDINLANTFHRRCCDHGRSFDSHHLRACYDL
jgi:hypothetical protein